MHRMDSVTNQNHSQQTIYYANGSVLGQINRTVLQSVQILRPECWWVYKSRPDRVGGKNPTLYAFVKDVNTEVDVFGLNALPETAMAWEKRLVTIPSSERYQAVIGKLHKVAKRNKWKQEKKISKMNNRIVYRDAENKYYAFDTQHGRFEYLDERGHYLGEFDIDGNQTKDADKKGKHNITCG